MAFSPFIELQKPKDGVVSKDYIHFISRFGLPRSGPGSEGFWEGYDHLSKVFKQQYPVEAGVLDLNRYGLDYMHTETVSFTDKSSGYFSEILEELMQELAQFYVESYVE